MLFEEEDLSLNLRNYYQDRGFAQVKVIGYEKRFTEDKTGLMLDITVDEGPEFIIGTYTLEVEAGAKEPSFLKRRYVGCSTLRKARFLTARLLTNPSQIYSRLISTKAIYFQKSYADTYVQ